MEIPGNSRSYWRYLGTAGVIEDTGKQQELMEISGDSRSYCRYLE